MSVGNLRKAAQLGMPISTASHRLKKRILFELARELGHDRCFHCQQYITDPEQLSIEHKVGWLYQDVPLFWDLTNIAFSHLRCNTTNRLSSRYDRGGTIEQRKAERLGVPPATAMAQLRVRLMLHLLTQLERDRCYRCGERILRAEQLSVEHKKAWLDNDPALFWDLTNITFSHRRCNSQAASRLCQGQSNGGRYRKIGPDGTAWCGRCRAFLPIDRFGKNRSRWNGVGCWCRSCERQRR
jgi:5-methylcytosine-specific restriction endonuclease McrA